LSRRSLANARCNLEKALRYTAVIRRAGRSGKSSCALWPAPDAIWEIALRHVTASRRVGPFLNCPVALLRTPDAIWKIALRHATASRRVGQFSKLSRRPLASARCNLENCVTTRHGQQTRRTIFQIVPSLCCQRLTQFGKGVMMPPDRACPGRTARRPRPGSRWGGGRGGRCRFRCASDRSPSWTTSSSPRFPGP